LLSREIRSADDPLLSDLKLRLVFYRAAFRENLGLCFVFGSFALFMLWSGIRLHETALVSMGLLITCFFVAMRLRLYVFCDGKVLEARGFFLTRRVALVEITKVRRAEETGFWASRLHGPHTYQFSAGSDCVTINFKFFSLDCMRDVMERVPRGTRHPG
jgi:hypothetical protein